MAFTLFIISALSFLCSYYISLPLLIIVFILSLMFFLTFNRSLKHTRYLILWCLVSIIFGASYYQYFNIKSFFNHYYKRVMVKASIVSIKKNRYQKYNLILKTVILSPIDAKEGEIIKNKDFKIFTLMSKDKLKVEIGDMIICEGKLLPLQVNKKYENYLKLTGVNGKLIMDPKFFDIVERDCHYNYFSFFRKLKNRIREGIFQTKVSLRTKNIILAVLFGEKQRLDSDLKQRFIRLNILHIFAISGLHFGILGIIIQRLISYIGIHTIWKNILSILFLFLFLVLIDFAPSACRAWLMLSFYWLAPCLSRFSKPLNILGMAGMILLFINPMFIFNPGFILSFTAVFLVFVPGRRLSKSYQFWLDKKIADYKMDYRLTLRMRWYSKVLILPMIFSFVLWIGTAPLIIHYFQVFSLVSVLSNLIAIYFLMLFLSFSLVVSFCGLFSSSLSSLVACFTETVLNIFMFITDLMDKIPGSSIKIVDYSLSAVLFTYFIMTLCWLIINKKITFFKMS